MEFPDLSIRPICATLRIHSGYDYILFLLKFPLEIDRRLSRSVPKAPMANLIIRDRDWQRLEYPKAGS
jgi:hypothetical protein